MVLEKKVMVNRKEVTHTYIFDRIQMGRLNPFLEASHWVKTGKEWMGRKVESKRWNDDEEGRKAGNAFYKELIANGYKKTDR